MKIVPADKHISTPIFLFATAGMRLLTKHQSDAIMKEVKGVFNDKTICPFTFNPETDAKVIFVHSRGYTLGFLSIQIYPRKF